MMIYLLIEEGVLNRGKCLLVGKPHDEVYYQEYREIFIEIIK
jgi:hypothetical protein